MKSLKFFFLIAVIALMQPILTSCDKDEQQDIIVESIAEQNAKKIESYNLKEAIVTGVSLAGDPGTACKFRVESPFIVITDGDNDNIYINLSNLKSMFVAYNCLYLRF